MSYNIPTINLSDMIKKTLMICLSITIFSAFPRLLFGWTESLKSIRKTADQVESISAAFVQEKHLAILKKPLISKGFLFYQRPNALRWEYRSPIASILMSYQGQTSRFFKQDGAFVKDISSNVQVMQVVLNEITNWLGGRFNEGSNFSATLEKNGLVVLKPSNQQMTKMIRRIELALSQQPGQIESVTIFESKNSFTKLIFHNTKLNDTLEASLFQNP